MFDWLQENETLLFWLGALSVGSLLLVALLLPVVVVRLPADYFVREHRIGRHGPPRWPDRVWHAGKNVLGALFVLVGIALLVLPGQGLLTILVGILLMDFPGKRKLERRLLRPGILRYVNRLRERRGRAPLQT